MVLDTSTGIKICIWGIDEIAGALKGSSGGQAIETYDNLCLQLKKVVCQGFRGYGHKTEVEMFSTAN